MTINKTTTKNTIGTIILSNWPWGWLCVCVCVSLICLRAIPLKLFTWSKYTHCLYPKTNDITMLALHIQYGRIWRWNVERIGWRISSKLMKLDHWPVRKCVWRMVGADRRFGGWGGLSPGRSSWQSLSRELVVLAPPESLQPSRGHCWKQPSLPPRWPNQQQEAEDRKCRRSKMALMLLTPSKSRRRAAKRCPVCNTTSILSTIVMPD